MAELHLIGSGNGLSLLRECANACVENGGDWYSAQQALAILGDYVGKPALLADAAFIGMATPERVLSVIDQRESLHATAIRVIRAFEALGRAGDLDVMQRRDCEQSMVALKEAVASAERDAHG